MVPLGDENGLVDGVSGLGINDDQGINGRLVLADLHDVVQDEEACFAFFVVSALICDGLLQDNSILSTSPPTDHFGPIEPPITSPHHPQFTPPPSPTNSNNSAMFQLASPSFSSVYSSDEEVRH